MNVVSLVALQIQKDGNNYHLLIPQGTPFDAVRGALDEMRVQLDALQAQSPEAPAENQPPASDYSPSQDQG